MLTRVKKLVLDTVHIQLVRNINRYMQVHYGWVMQAAKK